MSQKKSFKKLTIRDKFITYFHVLGYRPVKTRSDKYLVYFNGNQYIFLGSNGAVRVNSKNSVTGSISLTDQWKRVMENWAKQQGYEL